MYLPSGPWLLAGHEKQIISVVLSQVQHTFAGTGIIFTTAVPPDGQLHSTIYVGGDDAVFCEYGSFVGLAERVDVGNRDPGDEGLVFSKRLAGGCAEQEYAYGLAGIIAHEVGHLIGMEHVESHMLGSVLGDVAATLEVEPNDTSLAATALPLEEDPVGSGLYEARGLGSIDPTNDVDWWSFWGVAGDRVSVAVDTPDSSLRPYLGLYNSSQQQVSSVAGSGPGDDALAEYVVPASGLYYIYVGCWYAGDAGSYQVRLDVARGIQQETDQQYANDSIVGADVLTLAAQGNHRVATVAGTVMGPEGTNKDEDFFGWGTINAGNVVELTVQLPSTSSLIPWVRLVDANGVAVADEDGDPLDGHFKGTIPADGAYYAKVESLWSYNGHLYLLTDSGMTWSDAEAYAQGLGGHLVTVNDQAEQDWLQETLSPLSGYYLWLGLTDEAEEGTWAWSSGEAVSYTNWCPGHPGSGGSQDYAFMDINSYNGQWRGDGVSWSTGFYGLIELGVSIPGDPSGAGPFGQYLLDVDVLDAIPPTVESVTGLPAAGSTTSQVVNSFTVRFSEDLESSTANRVNPEVGRYNGHGYLLTGWAQTWTAAEAYAQSLGGHLVTVNDQAEQEWLYATFGRSLHLWIGLTDEAEEGTWAWSSGESVGYTNWYPGQPNSGDSWDYALMNLSYNGRWCSSCPQDFYGVIELSGVADGDGDGVPDTLDVYPTDPLNGWDVREAGADGAFDTADDVLYSPYLLTSYSSGLDVQLSLRDGPLGSGRYRLTVNRRGDGPGGQCVGWGWRRRGRGCLSADLRCVPAGRVHLRGPLERGFVACYVSHSDGGSSRQWVV